MTTSSFGSNPMEDKGRPLDLLLVAELAVEKLDGDVVSLVPPGQVVEVGLPTRACGRSSVGSSMSPMIRRGACRDNTRS